jgi:predicted Zn finger-like uncharacterized protein
MKIVCDSCGIKYSIADEKVRGKVFKIRCRKCSQVIVVRGSGEASAPSEGGADEASMGGGDRAAAAPQPGNVDAIWHLVIDRERLGPLTAADVRDRFLQGQITAETFTWREGLADWMRLAQVPEFADLAASTRAQLPSFSTVAAQAQAQGQAASPIQPQAHSYAAPSPAQSAAAPAPHVSPSYEAGEPATMGAHSPVRKGAARPSAADEFPDVSMGASQPLPESTPASIAASSADGDLFSSSHGGAYSNGNGAGAGVESAASRMTGQRNDNSVLFSLNNLAALGTSSAKKASPSPVSTPRSSGGSEPSGLIDIRAMAATLSLPQSGSSDPGNELPSSGFAPVAAPILIPVAASTSTPKWLIPVLAGAGGLLLVLVVALIYLVSNGGLVTKPSTVAGDVETAAPGAGVPSAGAPGSPQPSPSRAPAPGASPPGGTTPPGGAAPLGTQASGSDANVAAPGGGAAAAVDGAGAEPSDSAKVGRPAVAKPAPRPPVRPAANGKSGAAADSSVRGGDDGPKAGAASESPPTWPSKGGPKPGGDELDDLLNRATGSGAVAPKPRPPQDQPSGESGSGRDGLPDTLSVRELQKGMASVRPAVLSCGADSPVKGVANVRVTIAGSGRVTSVKVGPPFAGESAGSCIERAVRDATFPRFQRPSLTIDYPYTIR